MTPPGFIGYKQGDLSGYNTAFINHLGRGSSPKITLFHKEKISRISESHLDSQAASSDSNKTKRFPDKVCPVLATKYHDQKKSASRLRPPGNGRCFLQEGTKRGKPPDGHNFLSHKMLFVVLDVFKLLMKHICQMREVMQPKKKKKGFSSGVESFQEARHRMFSVRAGLFPSHNCTHCLHC